MSELLPSIELDISRKLRDRAYRQSFFLAESSALIAKQLIALRKRRGLNQTQLAQAIDTGQPAISRVERADYHNWSFNTLRRLAEAMDARLRVYIEPAEDVIAEYKTEETDYLNEIKLGSAAASTSIGYSQSLTYQSLIGSAAVVTAATPPSLEPMTLPSLFEAGGQRGIAEH